MLNKEKLRIYIRLVKRPDKIARTLFDISERTYPSGSPWTLSEFKKILSQGHIFTLLAIEDGEVRGFLCGSINPFEAEIYNIATDHGYKHLGIATQLINEMKHLIKLNGVSNLQLEVRESNLEAMRVYKMAGFQPIGKRKDYYINPNEDALILRTEVLYEERWAVNE